MTLKHFRFKYQCFRIASQSWRIRWPALDDASVLCAEHGFDVTFHGLRHSAAS